MDELLKIRFAVLTFVIAVLLFLSSCTTYRNIRYDYISFSRHPVQGLDVSHHQGEIDWARVAKSRFSFVFIKATEGGDFVDKRFAQNYREARKYGLLVGAYHFFSFKSEGKAQAENFISNVPNLPSTLPPVIDLEYMGHKNREDSTEKLHRELEVFIEMIEQHYSVKPILYTNYAFFGRYLHGSFKEYPVWIADYYKMPRLPDGRPWLFWQYTDKGKIAGINGYVDFNVFNGDKEELMKLVAE